MSNLVQQYEQSIIRRDPTGLEGVFIAVRNTYAWEKICHSEFFNANEANNKNLRIHNQYAANGTIRRHKQEQGRQLI